MSDETLAIWAERALLRALAGAKKGSTKAKIALDPRVAAGLKEEDGDWLAAVEEKVGMSIDVETNSSLEPGTVSLKQTSQ